MTRQNKKYTNETSFEWDENEDTYYTTVDNYICDNDNVEYGSQGMYLQIIKYKNSPTHKVYMSSLENKKGSRRDVQRSMLNLRVEGFIFRELKREDGKLLGYTYKIRRKPISMTDTMLLEIFNESKINREYIMKIYGKEFYDRLEELNKINGSTECSKCVSDEKLDINTSDYSNCVATKSVATKRATKKENNLKTKITKKENDKSSSSDDDEKTAILKYWKCVYNDYHIPITTKKILFSMIGLFELDLILELINKSVGSTKNMNSYIKKISNDWLFKGIITFDSYFEYMEGERKDE